MSGYGGVDDHLANIDAFLMNSIDVARAGLPSGSVSAEYCMDEVCGEEIPEGRRLALPGVQYCIDCADRHAPKITIRVVDHIL